MLSCKRNCLAEKSAVTAVWYFIRGYWEVEGYCMFMITFSTKCENLWMQVLFYLFFSWLPTLLETADVVIGA